MIDRGMPVGILPRGPLLYASWSGLFEYLKICPVFWNSGDSFLRHSGVQDQDHGDLRADVSVRLRAHACVCVCMCV